MHGIANAIPYRRLPTPEPPEVAVVKPSRFRGLCQYEGHPKPGKKTLERRLAVQQSSPRM